MKKTTLILLAVFMSFTGYTQEETEEQKDGWSRSGTLSFLLNQTAFNAEWTGGGTSNFAGNINLVYDANFTKGRLTWDNRFMGDYGLTKIKGDEFERKTNDRLEINSIVGYQLKESSLWSYSFFANFRTQFDKGFEFNNDANPITRSESSRFMSPGYLQFGPGMTWKKSDNLKVNIAPATSRLIFVNDRFTSIPGYVDGAYFGVDANETLRFEFGASLSAYAKFDLMENITMENLLNLYSNYLEDPQNVDIDYTMNLTMKVNKYLSANLIFQAIYDDNAVKGFQIREVFGLGLNFGL